MNSNSNDMHLRDELKSEAMNKKDEKKG